MDLKTREELSNEYWMRFLKSGKIEDYIQFKRINKTKIDEVEFAIIGEDNDHSKEKESTGTNCQER